MSTIDAGVVLGRVSARQQGRTAVRRWRWAFTGLVALLITAVLISLFVGSVSIPAGDVLKGLLGQETARASWTTIVHDYRLPKVITAALAGSALAVAGLALQTLFRNPLADSYVLGISSGASLGVALVLFATGAGLAGLLNTLGVSGDALIVVAAGLGAACVMLFVLAVARRLSGIAPVLIVGLMCGYFTSAVVSILASAAMPDRLQAFINWTFGTFGDVTRSQLPIMALAIGLGMVLMLAASKSLNALALGEDYARSMGIDLRTSRTLIVAGAAILAGTVTAFCGPIAFVGIAVPHACRVLLRTQNHLLLIPACALLGASFAIAADVLAQAPASPTVLPLNAVIALFGAPVVIWMVLRSSRMAAH